MDAKSPSTSTSAPLLGMDTNAFRLLVDSTLDYGIFMMDVAGHIQSWNKGAERIKGYSADEIIGRHFSTFYLPDAIAKDWPAHELREAARLGRFEDEGWRLRKDGSTFWANVVITALRSADGTLKGFGKVTRDLTERRAHEQRVQHLKTELEELVRDLAATNRELRDRNEENESFVYSVSHDLRSPLVNLQGFSHELKLTSATLEALFRDPRVPADIQERAEALLSGELTESMDFISNAVRHLGNIIDGLLRLSRVGRVEYRFEPVSMSDVANEILGSLHSTIGQSRAEVRVAPLPVISADRNAVAQVFANILGNALKSLEPTRPGLVEIAASDSDPPVFSIRDNGVGIPLEFQSKIFRVFQHVHLSRTRGEGMGLAIVRRIVERHGGRIWFESTPGIGTTFFFILAPVATSDRAGRTAS